ncbi:hypothetical protein V6N11_070243 [Hibiscus sabdariffa]|uniref:DUF397 domain-containing protein n=1 Tax=Hibiscus sabdariffa TaxID=183260 RepID=A0ABR2QEE5_9ROSI
MSFTRRRLHMGVHSRGGRCMEASLHLRARDSTSRVHRDLGAPTPHRMAKVFRLPTSWAKVIGESTCWADPSSELSRPVSHR